MELDLNILMIYIIKETIDSYNALFALATNTPVLLMIAGSHIHFFFQTNPIRDILEMVLALNKDLL